LVLVIMTFWRHLMLSKSGLREQVYGEDLAEFALTERKYVIVEEYNISYGVTCVNGAKELPQLKVTFYTKAGCHLCEEARDMLDDIAAQTPFELTEVDIRSNPEIFEQYRYRIPVIIINNDTLLEGRIEYRDLAKGFHLS